MHIAWPGLLALALLATPAAQARDLGQWEMQAPDISDYYRSLMQPDNPHVSCCGESDAYYADEVAECGPADGDNCALVAIITDTRDNESRRRRPIAVGTRISVPINKIRKKPVPNPTDHNIIFVGGSNPNVYCWEPQAGL